MDWSKIAEAVEAEQAEYRARKWQRILSVAGEVTIFTASAFFLVLMVYAALALA